MESFKCPICKLKFDTNNRRCFTLWKCAHSFCGECIDRQILQNSNRTLTCPVDSHIYENVTSSSDFTINTKVMHSIQQAISFACPEHQQKLEFFCLDDETEICSLCGLFGAHKGHQIIVHKELEDLNQRLLIELEEDHNKLKSSTEFKPGELFRDTLNRKVNEQLKDCKKQIDVLYQVSL